MKCVFFAGEFAGIFVCVLDGHLPISFLPASVCLKFNCFGKDFPVFFGFIFTHFQMLTCLRPCFVWI